MAASRRGGGRRTSTPLLAAWGLFMVLLGLGLGVLFSNQSCARKGHRPTESKEPVSKPSPEPGPSHKPSKVPSKSVPTPPPVEPNPEEPIKPTPSKKVEEPLKPAPAKKVEEPLKPAVPEKKLPYFALIIDDLGYAQPELVTRLCAQPVPFSVAVLPFQEFTKDCAEIAFNHGKEVMVHLPMEPIGYPAPGKDPGLGAVMYQMPESEVRLRVQRAMEDVPHRKGVNNHMGSRITPDRKRMTWVLQEIKARHCFFVDSRTEKDSVAFDVAEELKIPSVQRKVFLDDDKSFDEISKQWERAIGIAKKDGQVLIIGHIYPETVEALEKLIPRTRGEVKFVKAGELVK